MRSRHVFTSIFRALPLLVAASFALPASSLASGTNLTLVAFSTPGAAYAQLIPAFQQTAAGKGVTFTQSYGASGDQSLAVAQGLHADVVEFSLAPDMQSLVVRDLVSKNWQHNKYSGFITDSTVVFVVRKGNPKGIHTWSDLLKPGVDVLTPNPFTSGSARWNVMAAYGAMIEQHKTKTQAINYLQRLFSHVSVQDTSARNALNTFSSGKGDVLLSYQNDALMAQKKDLPVDIVTPPQSILIENPIAVTTETKFKKQANAFVQYLYTPAAQAIWAQNGYWPVVQSVLKRFHFANPHTLFTIRSLGGWTRVYRQFFSPGGSIMLSIERKKGINP